MTKGETGDSVGIVCDRCVAELFRAQVLGQGPEGQRLLAYSGAELQAAEGWHRCPALPDSEARTGRAEKACICGPWHPGCDGPQEDCPKHGRPYNEVWEIVNRLTDERDQLRDTLSSLAPEVTKKVCDGDRASGYLRLITAENLLSAWERLGGWE